jgi:hypothetical protein
METHRNMNLNFPVCSKCSSGLGCGCHAPSVPGIIAKPAPVSESAKRKGMPLFSGFLQYFPKSSLAVSEHSRKGNDKHNPGQPLHWAKAKSQDHADCVARHLVDIGPEWDAVDAETGSLHAVALVWRAHALLETVLEAKAAGLTVREYQARQRVDGKQ